MPLFSTPWKHQKTSKVFWCFQGVEKGCIGNEWVKVDGEYNFSFFKSNISRKGEWRKEKWDYFIEWASLGSLRHTQIV